MTFKRLVLLVPFLIRSDSVVPTFFAFAVSRCAPTSLKSLTVGFVLLSLLHLCVCSHLLVVVQDLSRAPLLEFFGNAWLALVAPVLDRVQRLVEQRSE